MRVCPFTVAVALFVHVFHQHAEWPYLAVVRVAAELDVYSQAVLLRYLVGLMIQQQTRLGGIGFLHQSGDGLATAVGTVVTSDNLQAIGKRNDGVAQKGDGSIF